MGVKPIMIVKFVFVEMSRGRGDFGYGSLSRTESGEFNDVAAPRPADRQGDHMHCAT